MSVLDPKKTYNNLLNKGFIKSNTHHKYLIFMYKDMEILHTRISHGSHSEINDYLIGQMYKQCKLSKPEFMDLAQCPMEEEDYIEILKEKGIIDGEECIVESDNEINKEILSCYGLVNKEDISEFLSKNEDLYSVLFDLCSEIYSLLPPRKLALELFDEGDDWKTLFINIYVDPDFEHVGYSDFLLEYLAQEHSSAVNKINFSFYPFE